ncbi:chromatin modification-related protein YNG2, partial [Tremellales sp. Uapishka_1]
MAQVLHVGPSFNPEDAAQSAAEFVGSLDNLPGEVVFLLEEIKEKDIRINQLIQRINTRHYGLTKHVRNLASASGSSTPTATFPLPIPPGAPLPLSHLSAKDAQAITKIQAEWIKVEALQEEKIKLAERLERIVSRARERGKTEWKKVGGLDLDEVEDEQGKPALFGEMGNGEIFLPPGGLGSGDSRPVKRKKPSALPLPLPSYASTPIIHPPNNMPPPPAPSSHRQSLSARSQHSHRSSRAERQYSTSTMSDADAEGELEAADQGDGGDGETDDNLYCLCHQKSYGEMIGCDNDGCAIEWFHVKCVGIVPGEVPENWYCPACIGSVHIRKQKENKKSRKR